VHKEVARFAPYVTERSHYGVRRKIHITDGMGQAWYDHDAVGGPEIALLKKGKLRTGARVFDCGAHQSVVAMVLADAVGPSGEVIAVEGSGHNFETSLKNIELNQCSNLKVIHSVISDTVGRVQFMDELNGKVGLNGAGTWVNAISIDELSRQHGTPQVMFIDIEGFECHALRGATETLRSHPDCYVEVHIGHGLEAAGGSAAEVVSFFDRAAYDLYYWVAETETPALLTDNSMIPSVKFCLVALSKPDQSPSTL